MVTKKILALILFTVLVYILSLPVYAEEEKKILHVQFVEKKIKIDGHLDEDLYNEITPVEDFIQFHPKNDIEPTFKTLVYAFYDNGNIYFSFKCFDPEPGKISGDITPFDSYENNDEIIVYLDTYKDKLTYDVFKVNPRGIMAGENKLWIASAQITDYGWSAEIKIPFKSLRFPNRDIQHWGVNFCRTIFRLNETDYWTKVERNQAAILGDTFADLEGIKNIKGGKNIELFPYAGVRFSEADGETDNKLAGGIDLKYGITSNLTMDLTSSPDYSEVESDPFFYQITPYEFDLAENRPFYNEGSSYFATSFDLFYSRRITNPTLAFKITGKEKGFSLGMLAANNRVNGDDRFHGVFRLKKDVAKLSTVGVIYSSMENGNKWNRNVGADFSFRIKKIYSISGMTAFTFNQNDKDKDIGMYRLQVGRAVDKGLGFTSQYLRIGADVATPAGYTPYIDFQRFLNIIKYNFRWEGRWLESLNILIWKNNERSLSEKEKVTDTLELVSNWSTRNRINLVLTLGLPGKIRAKVYDSNHRLIWEKHLYNTRYAYFTLSFNGNRDIQFGFKYTYIHDYVYSDDFTFTREGKLNDQTAWVNLKLTPQMKWEFNFARTRYYSLDGLIDFNGTLVSTRFNYQLNKQWASFLKFQYDSGNKRFQYDFLMGYEITNLSKIVLSIKNYSEERFRFFNPDARSIALKFSYLLRI